ncbi:hypothetical protein ACFWVC_28105 [Streptomyces sp. NPDC058691]|uniref:hypothetical protein n=1 Tax=Streptomyces sp. NPDC058691 TaxID=3346601 RepID=UPI0036531ECB
MTINMTLSLPDEVGTWLKSHGNASATAARILRRAMLEEALAESSRVRKEAGIVITTDESSEAEGTVLARWAAAAAR